jgi:hypothetical protein
MNEEYAKKCFIEVMEGIGVPKHYYSLDGYQEESVCMSKQDGKWIVFEGERASKYNIQEFSNIKDACIECIRRLAYLNEEFECLKNRFECLLSRENMGD